MRETLIINYSGSNGRKGWSIVLGANLLATKIFLPIPQVQWIERERLISRLNAGLANNHRLSLISASAGAGKSSLLAEWAATQAAPVVWVSLDQEDNDPVRFWAYFLAAIHTRSTGQLDNLLATLRSPQPPAILPFLDEVVNQMAVLPFEKLVLVLDDYHVIDAKSVHDSLSYFLDHIPPTIHVVIATRSDPPLPLHRWRGRGQLTEIRFDDLRFTLDETQLFLIDRMKLALNAEDIAQLENRTEGWIVGLHLAALLMQGRNDPGAFIARFSSNNHYILEYLTNEVLDRLPENEQQFLLQISILPQFNPPLCDAVTGRSESQAFLDHFWKANLFLIPLDDDHYWYRYHHLFADLLGQKLKQQGDAALRTLQQRAANWYAANQMIDDAIRSALAAKNYTMAGDLIVRNRRQSMNAGDFRRFYLWMEQIPADVLAADARYSLVFAAMIYNNGQVAPVEGHLANAQRIYSHLAEEGKIPPDDPEYATLPAQIAAFRAMLALRRWDLPAAIRYAEDTLRVPLAQDLHSRGMAGIALGRAQSELGRWEEAIQSYRQAIPTCEGSGNSIGAAVCYHQLAMLYQLQGKLEESQAVLETALEQAAVRRQESVPATGVLLEGQAEILYEKNRLPEAEEKLEKGLALVRQGGYLDIQKTAAILKAKLCAAAGNLPEAVQVMKSAFGRIRKASMEMALSELRAYQALFDVALGKQNEAVMWAETLDAHLAQAPGFTREIELFCLARVWILLGSYADAWNLLIPLEKYAQEGNNLRRQAEAQLLLALCAFQQNRRNEGFALLEKSILFGVRNGYIRLYLDEGQALRTLLLEFLKSGRPDKLSAGLVQNLLAEFPRNKTDDEATNLELQSTAKKLIEPLSERELEVLGLMAQGLTNPQIADRLILSLSTVKTHLNNIFGKLNVRNRAEAVLRAKEYNLL